MAATAAQAAKWRLHPQAIEYYAYIHKPDKVMVAEVDGTGYTYPAYSFDFTNVSVGSAGAIKSGMLVTLGSTSGGWDYGTSYVRTVVGSEIHVGWFSQGREAGTLDLNNATYVTVWDLYPVFAKSPRISDAGVAYKWGILDFTTYGAFPHPVANGGPAVADLVDDSSEITVYFSGTGSFATALGGSITAYSWDFVDGTPSSSSSATPGNVTFPAGFRHVSLTVTDSNGESHTCRIPVAALTRNTGGANDAHSIQIRRHIRKIEGSEMAIRCWDDLSDADYPPGTLVMIFAKEIYGQTSRMSGSLSTGTPTVTSLPKTGHLYVGMRVRGTGIPASTTISSINSSTQVTLSNNATASGAQDLTFLPVFGSLVGPTSREHMLFTGYIDEETVSWEGRGDGLHRVLDLKLIDVAGRLTKLPGFSQELKRAIVGNEWGEAPVATHDVHMGTFIWYILYWHSSALEVADFTWGGTGYDFSWLISDGKSLYAQADERCQAIGYRLTCNRFGQLAMKVDPWLQAEADRTVTNQIDLEEQDWGSISYSFNFTPRVHWERGAAILTSTAAWDSVDAQAAFSIAPGKAPGQGLGDNLQNYQLVQDADELYTREGRRYRQRQVNLHGMYNIQLAHLGEIGIEPADMIPIRLTASTADRRNRTLSNERMLPQSLNLTYGQYGIRTITIVAEREAIGDIDAVPDPRPAVNTDLFGPWGGEWGTVQWESNIDIGIPTIDPIDWGPEIEIDPESPLDDPDLDAPVDLLFFGLTTEGYFWEWNGNTNTFIDKSPPDSLRAAIGTSIMFHQIGKKIIVLGTTGRAYTNDITVASPIWYGIGKTFVLVTFSGGYPYTIIAGEEASGTYDPNSIGPDGDIDPGDGVYLADQDKSNAAGTADIEFEFEFIKPYDINGYQVDTHRAKPGVTLDSGSWIVYLYNDAGDLITSKNITANVVAGNWRTWYNASITHSVQSVKKIRFKASMPNGLSNTSACAVDNFAVDLNLEISGQGVPIQYFAPKLGEDRSFYWLSKSTWMGADWVWYNVTHDFFDSAHSTPVAPWHANMIYSFTYNPHRPEQVYVSAGDPTADTAAIYASYDDGVTFESLVPLVNYGGPLWWNWATETPNVPNTSQNNLMMILGLDGSDYLNFRKYGAGSGYPLVQDATQYPGGPLALGAIARDMSHVRYAARTGEFYVSSDGGDSFAQSATDIPIGSGGHCKGWWQFPPDYTFAVAFGNKTFAYTLDSGDTWSDKWGSYETFRAANFSSGGYTLLKVAPDLSYKRTPNG